MNAAAINQGYDLASYSRRIYVLPSNNTCGWAGLGTVGGNPSNSWIMECDIEGVYAHELGHNIGMHHAGTGWYAYGDYSDIMGASGPLYKINAPHHDQMGWLPDTQILEVSESNTYDIAPLGTDPSQTSIPQMLKIAKPDTSEFYYISFRKALGFDRNMASTYHDRTSIHTYKGDDSSDMTDLKGTIGDGESYTDTVNGWSFTQLASTENYATVRVDLGDLPPPVCTAATPDVSLSPSSQSAESGTSLGYTITIRNNDDSNCDSSSFNLASVVPSGWSAGLSKSSLSLAPGATGYASLTATSSSSASAKSYGIQIEVSNSSESLHAASANATYTVVESCVVNAPSLTLSQTSQSGDAGATLSYAFSLSNNDSAACGTSTFDISSQLPGGWSGSVTPATMVLSPGSSANGTLQVTSSTSASAESYSVGLQVTDSSTPGHNASDTTTYVVNEPVDILDSEAPTTPTGLAASANFKQVDLTWNPSSDNVAVSGYLVWRDGANIAYTTDTSYTDMTGADGESYTYRVSAMDLAGNESAQSAAVISGKTVKTKGGGKPASDGSTDGGTDGDTTTKTNKGKGNNK